MLKATMAACAALSLVACATPNGPGTGTGSPTSSVISLRTADEKAMIAAEGTYKALLIAVEAGVDGGAIKGERATQAAALVRKAKGALDLARSAYDRGQSVQMAAELANATGAFAALRGILGR